MTRTSSTALVGRLATCGVVYTALFFSSVHLRCRKVPLWAFLAAESKPLTSATVSTVASKGSQANNPPLPAFLFRSKLPSFPYYPSFYALGNVLGRCPSPGSERNS